MKTQDIEYRVQDVTCRGYLVEPKAQGLKLPGVVMYTDFWGLNPRQKKVAEKLSQMGMVVLVADMYGEQQIGNTFEESGKLMHAVVDHEDIFTSRLLAPFELLKRNSNIHLNKLFSIGYCFGGVCSLKLARMVDDLHGAISVHGLLATKHRVQPQKKMPKLLVLHGARDPMVPQEDIVAFQHEMNACNADYTFIAHGLSTHAFTNADAAGTEATAYNFLADKRSDMYIKSFIFEQFSS